MFAEAAPGKLTGGIPTDIFFSGYINAVILHVRRCVMMAGLFTALRAMAVDYATKGTARFKVHFSAKARAFMQFRHQMVLLAGLENSRAQARLLLHSRLG